MKFIALSQGKEALVDNEDYEYINQWKWSFGGAYALRNECLKGGKGKLKRLIYMHRLIMNAPENMEVDHIDLNKLNCQKYNLRLATHQQNMMNRSQPKNNTSGIVGVTWDKINKMWVAQIMINKKGICLGRFNNIKDAEFKRIEASKLYFGEFRYQGE